MTTKELQRDRPHTPTGLKSPPLLLQDTGAFHSFNKLTEIRLKHNHPSHTQARRAREDNPMNSKLSAPVKSLCNKIALERTRPVQWHEASQLRRKAIDMLGSGQSDGAVIAWLQALLGDALKSHARR